ncbi:MAG: choice-of-anchor Q domain-containing protein [Betaproteobacteria bacterium]
MRATRLQLRILFAIGWAFALHLALAGAAHGVTLDVTSQFAITRTGLVLNRATNTFDSTFTLRNTSGAPVLGALNAAVSGLPLSVTLANKVAVLPDGRPYVVPLAAGAALASGATISFVLKFANPQNTAFTSTLQILYTFETPANAPSLIGVLATGGTNAFLIGRIEGASNRAITLQAFSASACFLGTLVSGLPAGGTVGATTDASGYFGVAVSGVNLGAFVAVKLTSPFASPLSACQVSSRDNDSWAKSFPLSGATAAAQDYIDAPGKARWYRFSVQPGQRVQVSLSGLPADYDLAVFKDIAQAFLSQFNPATASTRDLVKLTAEYAPSVFSPSVFSPSVFSPDAYSPSVFSPSVFSPSVFSPSVFSPSVFSPSVFSPSVFSPSVFSPSVFSPSVFSPSVFSPSVFSPNEIAQAFSVAQTRSIVAVAATPGTASESTVVNTWNNTGDFYVRVTGRNGAFSTSVPFNVGIVKGVTTCASVTDMNVTARSPVAATGLKTVIVTDSAVLALDDVLPTPGGGTLRGKLAAFADRAEIKGIVVDVADDTRVSALKQQANANPACPFAKNLVAEQIKRIIDSYRSNPLRYVVLVGNDASVPFFRSPDQSNLGQESGFVPPVQSNSPSEASLRRDFVLSQDGYGSATKLSLTLSDFPVPGLAVGRLIESPAEIAGMLDAYGVANGVVIPHTSLVTGYDFLEDAANAVRTELQLGTGGTSDTLITPNGKSPQDPASWTATQLKQKLLGARHDVIFLAGHFSANSALAADFSTSLLTNDLAVSTVDLANSLVFSAGCHSGFNIVDGDAIPGATFPLDWAQAFARKRATLIAGTGYQYGDTDFLEYSERLYRNFARALRGGTGNVAIGDALVQAKLEYLAATPDIRGIHEKALLEATLFGLPMLAVNMPSGRGAVPPNAPAITPIAVSSGPAATLGLKTFSLSVAPSLTPQSKTLKNLSGGSDVVASWLGGSDGVLTRPGEPVLPLATVNVTPTDPNVVLRGVGFRGGTYADSAPIIPFSGAPATEIRSPHVAFASPAFYPARMWNPNYFGVLAGNGATQLLVTPAQHRVVDAAAGTSTQRKYTGLNLQLFYSGNLSKAALSEAPSITSVDEERQGADLLFTVQVVGDPAAAIHQVWITYTRVAGTTWTSLDLKQCVAPLPVECTAADSRLWRGRLAAPPADLKYMAQAVSGVGLVALDDNRGLYYGISAVSQSAPTLALVSAPTSAVIGDSVDVKTKLAVGGVGVAGKIVTIAVGGITQIGTTATDGTVTIKFLAAAVPGSYTISAFFDGDENFLPASVTGSFQVNRASASLVGLSPAGATLTGVIGGKTQALQTEAVSFLVSGPSGSMTIFANTDNLGRATLPPPGLPSGTYNVTGASFAGNATFAPASITFATAQQFNVAKLAQTLSFGPLPDTGFSNQPLAMYATSTSGLPVAFSASGSCAVSANFVVISGLGICTITAIQVGDPTFAGATQVARTFNVTKADQTITFGPAPTGVALGQPLVTVSASSSSPTAAPSTNPIVFTSLTPGICSAGGVNFTLVNLFSAGLCTLAADQSGDALYNDAPQATLSFNVAAVGPIPATYTVTNLNNSGAGSLRDAIAQANAHAGADIVDFQAGLTGTIVLTSGSIVISGPLGILGPGAGNLTIDGNAVNRIFSVGVTFPACPVQDGPDYLVYISGLRLTNGRRLPAGSSGGAIYTERSLWLDSMVIDHNIARSGGGVFMALQYPGQSLYVLGSQFLDNTATEIVPPPFLNTSGTDGGAIGFTERCQNPNPFDVPTTQPVTVMIESSEFRRNHSQPVTLNGRGGAIRSWSLADMFIFDSIFVDNHVDAPNPPNLTLQYRGGAIEGSYKSVRIEVSEIAENSASDVTGGDVTRSGGLHLTKTQVNRQGPTDTMAVRIINSTISSNQSSATGGAMVVSGNVALELVNTTVSHNIAAPGRTGGILMTTSATYPPPSFEKAVRPSLTLVSSIVANSSGTTSDISTNTLTFPSFTVKADNSLIEKLCPTCFISVAGTGNVLGVDPNLGPLFNNGGPTRTHALFFPSPAIDAGSNPLGLPEDQRGFGFPRVVNGTPDMGAYEAPTP